MITVGIICTFLVTNGVFTIYQGFKCPEHYTVVDAFQVAHIVYKPLSDCFFDLTVGSVWLVVALLLAAYSIKGGTLFGPIEKCDQNTKYDGRKENVGKEIDTENPRNQTDTQNLENTDETSCLLLA